MTNLELWPFFKTRSIDKERVLVYTCERFQTPER